jgi:hypothetical protein
VAPLPIYPFAVFLEGFGIQKKIFSCSKKFGERDRLALEICRQVKFYFLFLVFCFWFFVFCFVRKNVFGIWPERPVPGEWRTLATSLNVGGDFLLSRRTVSP